MKKKLLVIIVLVFSTVSLFALELDEKLTLRILKTSSSNKTVLINRGLEDGLILGDHAKFFITTGVVARGVVVKTSPTRSVWSVYRVIDGKYLVVNQVMKLKIASEVKLTQDLTRMLIPEMPIKDGAEDIGKDVSSSGLTDTQKAEYQNFTGSSVSYSEHSGISDRTIEIFFSPYFSGLQVNVANTNNELEGSYSGLDLTAGVEKYFLNKDSFFHSFSFGFFIHSTTMNYESGSSLSALEYGGSANWHYLSDPLSYRKLIGYIGVGTGIGSTQGPFDNHIGVDGFYYLGSGLKYFFKNGFGGRVFLDYYARNEEYLLDNDTSYTISYGGVRMQAGISFRW